MMDDYERDMKMMDDYERDMKIMMLALLVGGGTVGAAVAAAVVYLVLRWLR